MWWRNLELGLLQDDLLSLITKHYNIYYLLSEHFTTTGIERGGRVLPTQLGQSDLAGESWGYNITYYDLTVEREREGGRSTIPYNFTPLAFFLLVWGTSSFILSMVGVGVCNMHRHSFILLAGLLSYPYPILCNWLINNCFPHSQRFPLSTTIEWTCSNGLFIWFQDFLLV